MLKDDTKCEYSNPMYCQKTPMGNGKFIPHSSKASLIVTGYLSLTY